MPPRRGASQRALCSPVWESSRPIRPAPLPQDVLLLVLAAAAPVVPLVLKPPRPHDVEWGEVAEHSSVELFRDAAPGGGGDAAAGRR